MRKPKYRYKGIYYNEHGKVVGFEKRATTREDMAFGVFLVRKYEVNKAKLIPLVCDFEVLG